MVNGSGSDIYQRAFYDQTSPYKERKNRDWSFLRQVYRIPLLPRVDKINCEALLAGNNKEIFLAKDIVSKREFTKVPMQEETYLQWTQNCASFKSNRGYITVPLTMEEETVSYCIFNIHVYRCGTNGKTVKSSLPTTQFVLCSC